MNAVAMPSARRLEHSVQFYEDPRALLETAGRFLHEGLAAGDAGVVIARERYRSDLEDRLRASGFEVARAREVGRYVDLDASETMSKFMVDGWPKDELFAQIVGDIVADAARSSRSGRVRIFGEIVALLWAGGKTAAAVRVEQLWNNLGLFQPFSLHCAYPLRGFGQDAHETAFLEICAEHRQIIPGETFTGLTQDGERRRAVAALQQKALSLEAEVARRDEAARRQDEFLAMLSHELRNPLSPIVTAVEIARRRRSDEDTVTRSLDIIERQADRLTRLVDDLLDISRVTRGQIALRPERVELADVVERAVEQARPLIARGRHALSIRVPRSPVFFQADPVRLEQALANLLINAARYTDAGGSIELEGALDGAHIVLRVRDNGIGFKRGDSERIFDLFTQKLDPRRRVQGGLGIGLTLVRRLVELHGGSVTASSDGLGRGSEFVVRLPVGT